MQRAMMETMRKALEVPHMTFCDEVVADRLVQLRTELKEAAAERGVKLSYLPFIIKVTIQESRRLSLRRGRGLLSVENRAATLSRNLGSYTTSDRNHTPSAHSANSARGKQCWVDRMSEASYL